MSPHQETSEALRTLIAAWGSLPAGFAVERGYSVDHYVAGWADAAPGRIVLLVSGIEVERIGHTNQDEATISVAYLRKVANTDLATLDTADNEADLLRKFLSGDSCKSFRLASASLQANRVNTTMPTPYAAAELRTNLVFAAIIATTYRILRGQS